MMQPDHPLFRDNPITGEVMLSTGAAPLPYHVYDGHGLLLTGQCDAAALNERFAEQDVYPVTTPSGAGVMGVFICDFSTASLGPHLELQAVVLSAPEPGLQISDDPTAFLAAFVQRPDWGPLSLHLWNDTPRVVAYNSEYLGLEAGLCQGRIDLPPGRMRFDFADASGPLISGEVAVQRWSDLRMVWALARQIGMPGMMRLARQPYAPAHLINRKSAVLPRNGRARTMTAANRMVVSRFNPRRERIVCSGVLARYGFRPLCVEHLSPFRFVYLHPDASL